MNPKEQIARIKKNVQVFHIVIISLLMINAIVWFFTLIRYGKNDSVLLIVGLSCVGFLISVLTGKAKYPFGNHIIEDLVTIKNGIKVENKAFYTLLINENFGEESNQLLSEICMLIANNSYILGR